MLDHNLECVNNSVQELDDKEWRHLTLDDCHKEDAMPEHADQVVMWCGDHRWNILWFCGPFLCLKEVVAH